MLKDAYATFFAACGDAFHVLAHSHHPWPDVTRDAQLRYWEDSARLTSNKWERIWGEVVPEAQEHVARWIGWPDPRRIAFAPNCHELIGRLYSCLDWSREIKVLTTTNEFASFARQTRRLEETGSVVVSRVPLEPYETFGERFRGALTDGFDLVFLSHVFYDSGFAATGFDQMLADLPEGTLVAIDGYHAVGAIPVDLAPIADRVFYLGGGYKYLQAGEGAGFMALPPLADGLRPAHTGWLADPDEHVGAGPTRYGPDALRFWGSTFDASGLYRLNAVMRLYAKRGIDAAAIRAHVGGLEDLFFERLRIEPIPSLPVERLVPPPGVPRGNFVAFDLPDAEKIHTRLAAKRVLVDRRGTRLRFGFGVYHDEQFVERLVTRLREALR